MVSRLSLARRHLALLALLLAGCSSMLPSSQNAAKSAWPDFLAVRQAYDRLVPMQSAEAELRAEKFHPDVNPQVMVLSQLEILRRFVVPNMPQQFIDPGVQACLAAQQKCIAYEIDIKQINRQRVGNVVLDVTSFKRNTEIRGWRFNGVFLVVEGRLVYKTWGGQAEVAEQENVSNPLGPVQTITPPIFGGK
ncbi:hypothetical protein [Parvibium lacunae]|uniref:Lipoprotein n=1 Tax=Parvibium lacunae TaxID=1888893 RepID=A0A368L036_9BURK|nr:hypothetical protein [Parvibium lacunae]RCS56754.1 hypothetical protein DU000_10405 [Parvibium lacunae]